MTTLELWLALGLARPRRTAARATWATVGPVSGRPIAVGPSRRATPVVGALALRDAVYRPRRLHLLARPDGIALLEQRRERRAGAFRKLVLKLLGQIGKRHIGVDRLNVAQQLVGQAARRALQRRDAVEHRREQDRLHDVAGGSRHDGLARWT